MTFIVAWGPIGHSMPTYRTLIAACIARRPGLQYCSGDRHCHVNPVAFGSIAGRGRRVSTLSYARHRFPSAIIQHVVWLYFRFALSYRDVERGIDASYELVRRWVLKFGYAYAARIPPSSATAF